VVLGSDSGLAPRIYSVRESAPEDPRVPPQDHTAFAATFVAGGLIAALTAWLRTNRSAPSATLVGQLLGLLPEWLVSDEATPHKNGN
jgi:hypothetical protein